VHPWKRLPDSDIRISGNPNIRISGYLGWDSGGQTRQCGPTCAP
jgi:hypothetical protein